MSLLNIIPSLELDSVFTVCPPAKKQDGFSKGDHNCYTFQRKIYMCLCQSALQRLISEKTSGENCKD
jgi:hypothetical protein